MSVSLTRCLDSNLRGKGKEEREGRKRRRGVNNRSLPCLFRRERKGEEEK